MEIIPFPAQFDPLPGTFRIGPGTRILTDAENQWNAEYLRDLLSGPTGFPLQVIHGRQTSELIQLKLDPGLASVGAEGYQLTIRPEAVYLEASTTAGVFYGIQSFRQLLPIAVEEHRPVEADWSVRCLSLRDQPRFSWRGFMLDDGRHFQGKATILLTLDLMALQKLNILHWHLTEDQGWRIEIKKYPLLTEIGSKRAGTSRSFTKAGHDGRPLGGFYTQEDIREIVAYAGERHITIVPEIESPGHCTAALAAYPRLSCTGGPFDVATHFGIFPDIFCAGKEATFNFLEAVFAEILSLFPSPFIHIGGDEAPTKRWKDCADCQARIRNLGLKDERGLAAWFTQRISAYIHSHGRRAIGWNEILRPGLDQDALIQYWWRNRSDLIDAIRRDRRATVMSTFLDTYLDHSYNLTPLDRAYRFEPVPSELRQYESGSILGLEAPLWTEWIPSRGRLDYQTYPRLTAMAETGWTLKDRKDFKGFCRRLQGFQKRMLALGVQSASLQQAQPAWFHQLLGIFSITRPQTRTLD